MLFASFEEGACDNRTCASLRLIRILEHTDNEIAIFYMTFPLFTLKFLSDHKLPSK